MKNTILKKGIALLLSGTVIFNTTANAQEISQNSSNATIENGIVKDIVYYDGVEYEVILDVESGDISVCGETDGSEGTLTLSEGEAIIDINNDMETETYVCEVNELSKENVDIELYDEEGDFVDEFSSYDEIQAEVYEGQIALADVALVIGAAVLLYITSVYIIRQSNITYVMADHFTKAINKAKEAARTNAQSYYYPAVISNGVVFIAPKGININSAALIIQADGNVYSFSSSMASRVITKAGYIPVNSGGIQNAYDLHNGERQKGTVQFKHYHRGRTNSRGTYNKIGSSHSLFGVPVYVN